MLRPCDMPERWHVLITEDNVDIISKWRFSRGQPKNSPIGYYLQQDAYVTPKKPEDSVNFWNHNLIIFLETELNINKTEVIEKEDYNYLIKLFKKLNIK